MNENAINITVKVPADVRTINVDVERLITDPISIVAPDGVVISQEAMLATLKDAISGK